MAAVAPIDEQTQPGEALREATPPVVVVADGTADTAHASLASASTLGSEAQGRVDVDVPARVGRYLILDRLGAGGMGVVYSAYDPELDRKVAIKLLRAAPGADTGARLLREAQALARLSHPNVVQIHDAGAHGDRIFLAMELVAGDNLRRWLDAETRSWRSILRVFVEAGRGLAAAHAVGIIHRDFKPENVLIGGDGRARVADFGLARQVTAEVDDAAASSVSSSARASALEVSLTRSGTVLGTPAYMAPEQFKDARSDARGDLFSLSVALYEALYRQRPFRGDTLAQLVLAMAQGQLREPPPSSVPRRIFVALRRGLAYAPEARWPDVESLLAALTHDPGVQRRRLASAAGLVLAAGAAAYALGLADASAPAACEGGDAAIAELWDEEAAAAIDRAIASHPRPSSVRARVRAGLDAYADAWVEGRRDACLAHARGDDSDAVQAARARCLDRRRSAFDGAIRLLRDARPGDDVVRVVAGLPPIDACARVDALMARPNERRDPATAAAILAVEGQVDEARTLTDAGRLDEADRTITAAIEAAMTLDARSVIGEARLVDARIDLTRTDWRSAASTLRLALADGLASQDDALAAEASARLLYARGLAGDEPIASVLADAPIAEAIVDRTGSASFARRRLRGNLGILAGLAGDRDSARDHLIAATEGLAAVVDADPLESANLLRSLAVHVDDPVGRRDAFDRAEAILSRTLGDDHPERLGLRLYRGRTSLDLDDASDAIESACVGYRLAFPTPDPELEPTCAQCGILLGALAIERGDEALALARFDEAATCDPGPARDATAQARIDTRCDLALAQRERLRGRPVAAIAAAERLLAALAPHAADAWWLDLERAEAWKVEGEAERERGDRAAAVAAYERAHAVYEAHTDRSIDAVHRHQRASVAFALAELLVDDADPVTRARAAALAREAREFHRSRGAAGEGRVAAIDSWLAAHPE